MKSVTWFPFALAASVAAPQSVVMNGRTVSTDVRVVGGKLYVSLADVAKALGMTVVKKGSGYVLVAAGGASQLRGKVAGKIGDDLFTGDWRFKVLSVQESNSYTLHFGDRSTVQPDRTGDKLIVVTCRLKNGHKKSENMHFSNQFATNSHSALTDSVAHSYPIKDFDVHYTYYNWGSEVLPGATIDFALVFEVPSGAKPKDLVYSIFRYEDRGNPSKTTDVRVALSK